MFKSIESQFAFIAVVLVVSTAGVIDLYQYWRNKTHQIERETERLDFAVQKSAQYLQDVIGDVRRKVLYLAGSSAVRGIVRAFGNHGVDPLDGSFEFIWKERLGQNFVAMAENSPEVLQIRFIQAANNGQEIVRVDRLNKPISPTEEADLQKKGHSNYVKETLNTPPGLVKLFNISLNRENGKIEMPPIPVLRVATPVYARDDKVFGLIVINIHMQPILDRLASNLPQGTTFYLTNESGDYLVHPDSSKTFGFELGQLNRIQADHSALASFVENAGQRKASAIIEDAQGKQIVHLSKVPFDPSESKHYFVAAAFSPIAQLLGSNSAARNQILVISGVLAAIGAILAMVSARLIVRPLQKLTVAAQKLTDGASVEDIEVPRERANEVGALARSFYSMATSLEERQESLEEKQAGIRAILEAAVSPIITIDDHGVIQDVNAATTELFEYSKEELIGANVSILMMPRDGENHDQYLRNYHKSRDAKVIGIGREVEARRKDGSAVPVHLAVSEVPLKGKKLFTGVITDLSELKKIDKLKREFVSTISHELRTPLNGIIGMADLMSRSQLEHKQRRYMNTLTCSAQSLLTIINEILDFSKVEAGKLEINVSDADLREVVKSVADPFSTIAAERSVNLIVDYPWDIPCKMRLDSDRLRQILNNLVSNALKFTEKGHVLLSVRTTSDDPAKQRGRLEFSVADTGIGMSQEVTSRIFQPFVQADGTTVRKYGGTGLGLSISAQLVELMGGALRVESKEGEGSRFFFEIPISYQADPRYLRKQLRGLITARILIVDAYRLSREALQRGLESAGLWAETASDACEAVSLLRSETASDEPYDVVLIDQFLADKNHRHLARELRKDEEIATPLLFALTNKLLSPGVFDNDTFDGQLEKPFHLDRVIETMADVRNSHFAKSRTAVAAGIDRAIASQPLSPPGSLQQTEQSQLDGMRVLLAEDDPINRFYAEELLTEFGCHVTNATNGEEIITRMGQAQFDVILMDCMMPIMDGLEATRVLRRKMSDGVFPRIPIIALTANAMKEDNKRCIAAGMDDYMSKPFDGDSLLTVLKRWADRGELDAGESEAANRDSPPESSENVVQLIREEPHRQPKDATQMAKGAPRSQVGAEITGDVGPEIQAVTKKKQAVAEERQGATNNERSVNLSAPAASKNEPVVAKVGTETPKNERSAAKAIRAVTKKEQPVIIEARAETKKEQIATNGQIATDGVKAVTKTDDIEGSSEAPVVDWAIYKKTETAMKNRFEALLDGFLDNTTRYVGEIGRALEQGDATLIALRAHTIKSSARIMGALQLAQAAGELEALSKSATANLGDLPEIKDNVTDLRELFDTTRLTLRTGTTAGAS